MTTTILGPDVGVVDIIDKHVLDKQAEEHAKDRAAYLPLRPSASGYCARKLAYDYSAYQGHMERVPEVKKASLIRLLDLGQHVERAVIDQLRYSGQFKLKYMQQSLHFDTLPNGIHIEGSPDIVIEFKDGSRGLYDVKSKNSKYSSWRENSWEESLTKLSRMNSVKKITDTLFYVEDIDAFFEETDDESLVQNITQCNFYALNPFMVQRGITFGGILRYNKNDSTMMELRFKLSQDLYDYVIEKFRAIAANETTPDNLPREAKLGSMACAFCPYAERCRPEVNTKKPFYESLPDKVWATDTSRMEPAVGQELDQLALELIEAEKEQKKLDNIQGKMLHLMTEVAGKKKIKTANGDVFEAKFLKTPKPRYELRRSKV